MFPAGTNMVSCTATDGSGNSTNCSFKIVVNRAPVAGDCGAGTTMNQAVTLPLAKLTSKCSDPDGDALTVISTSAMSTNGGGISLTVTNVTYTPLMGFSGVDRFTYTISDGRGGTASAAVEIFVASGSLPGLNMVSLTPTANGYLLRFAGIPGYNYRIQRATNVNGPWDTQATLTAPLHGIIEYEDTNPPQPTAFYRTEPQ